MVIKVCAEKGGLCAWVGEGNAQVTGDRRLVFLNTEPSVPLLKHHLKHPRIHRDAEMDMQGD